MRDVVVSQGQCVSPLVTYKSYNVYLIYLHWVLWFNNSVIVKVWYITKPKMSYVDYNNWIYHENVSPLPSLPSFMVTHCSREIILFFKKFYFNNDNSTCVLLNNKPFSCVLMHQEIAFNIWLKYTSLLQRFPFKIWE